MAVKKQNLEKKKNKKAVGIIVIAVLVIAAGVLLITQQKEKPIIAEQTNTEVFSALLKGGITSSNTVVQGDVVKVTYQLPEGLEKENAELYILGVTSSLVHGKKTVIISTYGGENKIGEIEVSVADVLKYKNKEISLEEFKKRFKSL